ncbi:MAG: hypothetical protein Q7R41_01070 [Phycisphaerales bacterium]|nr:hypothetical protein [Phycisphaerales bacterium]
MTTITERDILVANMAPTQFAYLMSEGAITSNRPTEVVVSPAWLGRVKKRIAELTQLPANWDSYGAVPVDLRIPRLAEDLVEWFAVDGMPPPDVFATSDGGMQIEWHIRRVNIEIEISPTEGTNLYFHDLNGGEPWSRPASPTDLQLVRRRLLAPV